MIKTMAAAWLMFLLAALCVFAACSPFIVMGFWGGLAMSFFAYGTAAAMCAVGMFDHYKRR